MNGNLEECLRKAVKTRPSADARAQHSDIRAAELLNLPSTLAATTAASPPRAVAGNAAPCTKMLAAMLDVISNSDRRIGKLVHDIAEVQRQISERTYQAQQIEAELQATRHDVQALDEEIISQARLLDEA